METIEPSVVHLASAGVVGKKTERTKMKDHNKNVLYGNAVFRLVSLFAFVALIVGAARGWSFGWELVLATVCIWAAIPEQYVPSDF